MQLPSLFTESARVLLGEEAYASFESALTQDTPSSIRVNARKNPAVSFTAGTAVPWCPEGRYLDRRPTFTFDPLFHAGCYYVQEASSMFLAHVLRSCLPDRPVTALDLCAAPGGKSTLMRSLLPADSLLVSNEVMRNRVQILAENLAKWGDPGGVVTNSDPSAFGKLEQVFDVLLTDVPCSGEGMFRKDPVAVESWSPANVELCRQRQRRILADVWPALKPGGILIYSTCTFNTAENEENVRWIADELGAEYVSVPTDPSWQITGNLLSGADFPVYRFLPHLTRGEGLFMAVLRKTGSEVSACCMEPSVSAGRREPKGKKKNSRPADTAGVALQWLLPDSGCVVLPSADGLAAFPSLYVPLLERLQKTLRIVQLGVSVGLSKGNDLIPLPGLALSCLLRPDAFPTCELNYGQAIAYLRREALVLSPETGRGYVLLTYRQIPLGFVKNLGNRSNNLYPAEWRIRSGYLPEEVVLPYGNEE